MSSPQRSLKGTAQSVARVEARAPVVAALAASPVEEPQVVDHVAAAEHQDPAGTEGRQAHPEVEVLIPPLGGVDPELEHGAPGCREQVDHHRPGPVVEAPTVVVEPA